MHVIHQRDDWAVELLAARKLMTRGLRSAPGLVGGESTEIIQSPSHGPRRPPTRIVTAAEVLFSSTIDPPFKSSILYLEQLALLVIPVFNPPLSHRSRHSTSSHPPSTFFPRLLRFQYPLEPPSDTSRSRSPPAENGQTTAYLCTRRRVKA